MNRLLFRVVATLFFSGVPTSVTFARATAPELDIIKPATNRSVFLLDKGWPVYKLPDFQLWPAGPKPWM